MANFTDFILKLGSDPALVQKLKTDPDTVISAAGLSAAEKDLFVKGDPNSIRHKIAEELGVASSVIVPFFTLTSVHVHISLNVSVITKQI